MVEKLTLTSEKHFRERALRLLAKTFMIGFLLMVLESDQTVVANDCPPHTPSSAEFIYQIDGDLYYQGQEFPVVGPNIYWLGLAHHGGLRYPTQTELDEALDTAVEMGATVIRSHALVSVGCDLCIQTSATDFNPEGLEAVHNFIEAARARNLRLILTLSDNWDYGHGGRGTFVEWAEGDDNNDFFEDEQVIELFKRYLDYVLTEVNPDTGLAIRDDPTVMALQIGNELGQHENHVSLVDFTAEIAAHIRSLDPNHLILDGRSTSPYVDSFNELGVLNNCQVDGISIHGYPPSLPWISQHVALAEVFGKSVFLDEFGFQPSPLSPYPPTTPNEFFDQVDTLDLDGVLYWSLFIRDPDGKFYNHQGDVFTQLYPYFLSLQLRRMAFELRDLTVPPIELQTEPRLTAEIQAEGIHFSWFGVVGAYSYNLEQSANNETWETVLTELNDFNNTALLPTPVSGSAYFRLVPFTPDNMPGAPSAPVYLEFN